jgi:predicted nucleic acid-binding protein
VTPVVVDASALAAVAFREPGFERVAARLHGVPVFAPTLLKYELASVARTKARRHPREATLFFAALAEVTQMRSGIVWQDISPSDVALIAHVTGLSAYDASYVWLAGSLGADLVTLDERLGAIVSARDTDL